jgi:hypothetical protein
MGTPVLASIINGDVLPPLLLYVGPEVLLPLSSALAAVAGLAIMFWQRLLGATRSAWRAVSFRKK